jgi:hypothetical protein
MMKCRTDPLLTPGPTMPTTYEGAMFQTMTVSRSAQPDHYYLLRVVSGREIVFCGTCERWHDLDRRTWPCLKEIFARRAADRRTHCAPMDPRPFMGQSRAALSALALKLRRIWVVVCRTLQPGARPCPTALGDDQAAGITGSAAT